MTADPDEYERERAEMIPVTFDGGPLSGQQTTTPVDRSYFRDRKTGAQYRLVTTGADGRLVSVYQFTCTYRK